MNEYSHCPFIHKAIGVYFQAKTAQAPNFVVNHGNYFSENSTSNRPTGRNCMTALHLNLALPHTELYNLIHINSLRPVHRKKFVPHQSLPSRRPP